jgi:hypothetical protein
MIHQFDLILDQKIAPNTVLSVSYIGSQGRHLPLFIDENLNPPTATTTYAVTGGPLDGQTLTEPLFTSRPNAAFSQMTQITDAVNTSYNALVLALNRRFTKGLQVQTSYTYSRSTDNGQSSQTFTTGNNVLNPFNLGLEQSRSSFDVPHRFSFNAVWQPQASSLLLSNWTFAPVIGISSGGPLNAGLAGNSPSTSPRPILTGVLGAGGTNRLPEIQRNAYRLPYFANVDLRVSRSFPLQGKARVEALVEAFNLLNRINYTAENTTIYSVGGTAAAPTLAYNPTFGTYTNANSGTFSPRPREIQIGLRFNF